MKSPLLIFLTFFTLININKSQNISPQEIISKSQKYHDPNGLLTKAAIELSLNEPRPNGGDRKSKLVINIPKESFSLLRTSEEHEIYMAQEAGVFKATFDGSSDISEEDLKNNKINAKRFGFLKDYYEYLWLLPIKLNDPGTIIAKEVKVKDFFGKEGYEIKVSYSPAVGKDIWYFYFDQSTYAMIGYRFYHDESKNDGEYILLEGEAKGDGIRIPATRSWYKHQKSEYLGKDILEEIRVLKK